MQLTIGNSVSLYGKAFSSLEMRACVDVVQAQPLRIVAAVKCYRRIQTGETNTHWIGNSLRPNMEAHACKVLPRLHADDSTLAIWLCVNRWLFSFAQTREINGKKNYFWNVLHFQKSHSAQTVAKEEEGACHARLRLGTTQSLILAKHIAGKCVCV